MSSARLPGEAFLRAFEAGVPKDLMALMLFKRALEAALGERETGLAAVMAELDGTHAPQQKARAPR
jgi:hypothetical protein